MSHDAVDHDHSLDLAMAAASLRADEVEIAARLTSLVTTLEDTPGIELVVIRRGGWLSRVGGDIPFLRPRSGPITRLRVSVDGDTFDVTTLNGVHCRTGRRSATGQTVDQHDVSWAQWSDALLVALKEKTSSAPMGAVTWEI